MELYIILLIIYSFLALSNRKVKIGLRGVSNTAIDKIYCAILIIPLFITVAFRGILVGNDTKSYLQYFNHYTNSSLQVALTTTSKEAGYVLFNHLMGKLGIDYRGFLIIIAALTYALLYRYLTKHSKNYALSILVFICSLGYFRSMNIMREMLAVMICLNAIDLLEENKTKRFIVVVIIASFFHRMSIVVFGLLLYKKMSGLGRSKKYLIITVAAISYLFLDRIFQTIIRFTGRYEYLYGSMYTNENGYLAMFALLVFTIAFMLLERNEKIINGSNEASVSRNEIVLFSYDLLFILCIVGFGFGLADRAALVFSMMFMETITHNYKQSAISLQLLKFVTILMLIVYFILVMTMRNNWQGTIPYVFSVGITY